ALGVTRRTPAAAWAIPLLVFASLVLVSGKIRYRAALEPFGVLLAAAAVARLSGARHGDDGVPEGQGDARQDVALAAHQPGLSASRHWSSTALSSGMCSMVSKSATRSSEWRGAGNSYPDPTTTLVKPRERQYASMSGSVSRPVTSP